MKNKLSFFYSLITLLFCSSCKTLYLPNSVHVSQLSQQHEARVSSSIGTNGVDFKAAYSPIKNLGIMVDGNYYWKAWSFIDDNIIEGIQGGIVEGGIGYYTSFGKSPIGIFEVYSGLGAWMEQNRRSFRVYPRQIPAIICSAGNRV